MLVVFEPYSVPDEEGSKVLKGTQSQSSLRPVSEEAAIEEAAMPNARCGRDDVPLAFQWSLQHLKASLHALHTPNTPPQFALQARVQPLSFRHRRSIVKQLATRLCVHWKPYSTCSKSGNMQHATCNILQTAVSLVPPSLSDDC